MWFNKKGFLKGSYRHVEGNFDNHANNNIGADNSSQNLIEFDFYYLHLYQHPTSILAFSEK